MHKKSISGIVAKGNTANIQGSAELIGYLAKIV